jgi:hypothetical protein
MKKPKFDPMAKCRLVQPKSRPGIIKAFMLPTKLRNQVVTGAKTTDINFVPIGKTLVGGTQWAFQVKRPGIAKAQIKPKVAKAIVSEQKGLTAKGAIKQAQKTEKKLAKELAKGVAAAAAGGVAMKAKVSPKGAAKIKLVPKGAPKRRLPPPPAGLPPMAKGVAKKMVKLPPPPPLKK